MGNGEPVNDGQFDETSGQVASCTWRYNCCYQRRGFREFKTRFYGFSMICLFLCGSQAEFECPISSHLLPLLLLSPHLTFPLPFLLLVSSIMPCYPSYPTSWMTRQSTILSSAVYPGLAEHSILSRSSSFPSQTQSPCSQAVHTSANPRGWFAGFLGFMIKN
jgi:hypothetical protein